MKKQFRNLAIIALVAGFTSCKSSTDTRSSTNKSEQTERRGQQQGKGERPDASQILEQMDANNDGKLSKSEVKGPLKENFSKIDSNNDDYISKEELENAPKGDGRRSQGGRPQGGRN